MNLPVERPSLQISLMILTVLLLVNSINGQPKEYIRENKLTYLSLVYPRDAFSILIPITPPSAIWNVKQYRSQTLRNDQQIVASRNPVELSGGNLIPGNYWLSLDTIDRVYGQSFLEVLPSNTFFNLRFSVVKIFPHDRTVNVQVYLLGAGQPMTFRKQYDVEGDFKVYLFNEKFETPPDSEFRSINFASLGPDGYHVTDIYLTEILCNDGKILKTTSGQYSCIPNDVIAQSANCFKFQNKPVTTNGFQCGQCDPSVGSKLVNITGGYKGCIVDQNDAFDSQCSKYNYKNSIFNCSECQSNNQKVNTLFQQIIFAKCLLKQDIKYDQFCSIYQKGTFKCRKCQASRIQVKVQDGDSEFNRCILRKGADSNYDPNCLVYNTSYSCIKCDAAKGYLLIETISGQKSCVPSDVIAQSANCFKFQNKPGTTTEFQCGQCDTTALSYQLVNITGGYKGCIANQNNAFDSRCSKYNYEKSVFNCSECQSNNQKVNTLFLQMIFAKCLLETDIKYDPFCQLYQKDPFKCQKCQASRTQVKVQDGDSKFNRCILRTNYDPNCLVYDTSYSCLQCNTAQGYLNVLVEVGDTYQNKCVLSARLKQRNCRAYDLKFNCVCDKFIVKVSRKGKIIWKCVANKLDLNCEVFFENLKCAKCKTGYQTNANSICVKTKTNGKGGAIII